MLFGGRYLDCGDGLVVAVVDGNTAVQVWAGVRMVHPQAWGENEKQVKVEIKDSEVSKNNTRNNAGGW